MPTLAQTQPADPAAPAPPGKPLPPELQKAVARLAEISSLPEIITRIVEVVEDPRASAADMHGIVKHDPALATRILKVVNSAFYGLPAQIASLDRAIIMIGLSGVKNLALAASLAHMFRGEELSDEFAPRDLWRHSIAVGVCSRLLARRIGLLQADEFFVAGLVHEMGLLVLNQLFPAKLREVTARCRAEPQDFCAAERAIIGADHQAFGGALASKWRFPPALRHAASYHHDPDCLNAEFRRIGSLVHLADTLCARLRHGYYLTAWHQPLRPDLLELVKLDEAGVDDLLAHLPEPIAEAERILGEAG